MEKLALSLPGGQSVRPVAGMPDGDGFLQSAISFGLTTLLIIVTLAALIFLIWGGIAWITSQGDKGKIESARKRIVFAIIGLIVAFASFFIIRAVGTFFGVSPLNVDLRETEKRCGGKTFGICSNPDRPICRRDSDTRRYRCQCDPSRSGCAF